MDSELTWIKTHPARFLLFALIAGGFFIFAAHSLTTIHELGHEGMARLLGCDATSRSAVYSGVTHFECPATLSPEEESMKFIQIAYAGPLLAFLVSLILWFGMGKNSILRIFGLTGFMYSVGPNLDPFLVGSDAFQAVTHAPYALDMGIALIIYFVVTGIWGALILIELKDKLPEKIGEYFEL